MRREPPKFPYEIETELDRISNLPGHILDQILSQLPLEEAARTSVLSSKWRYRWAKVPDLVFDTQHVTIPSQDQSLIKSFRDLKSLDLQHITLTQDAFENLISSCPLLERLTLMNFDGFSHLKINAPNLQFVDVGGVFDDLAFENTFQLNLVSIGLYRNAKDDQRVAQGSCSKLLSLFVNLPRIRRLEIQNYFLQYLAMGNMPSRLAKPCVDLNYISLCINFNDAEENSAALCLLRSAPNLQELEMLARPEEQSTTGTLTGFLEDNHGNSLFGQLRIARIVGISGVKSELDFINFLLLNSPVLERMTVKPAPLNGGREFIKQLLRFRRASVQAEIIYLDP